MLAFLNDILEANGGIDRWHCVERFAVHFSMDGGHLASKGRRGALKDLAAEGSTRTPALRFMGFPAPNQRAAFLPGSVAIETLGGAVLASCDDPQSALRQHPDGHRWDDLHLTYYGGLSIWSCLIGAFVLARPGVQLEELAPWDERGETWRRVKARFPADAHMLSQEQLFYFDRQGLLRRTDYTAIDPDGTPVALYSWAHQSFSGILVPTLYRGVVREPAGTAGRSPSHVDMEIFDVQFE